MYAFEFQGGADFSNKFLLYFALNQQEVSLYTLQQQGLATAVETSETMFQTNHRFARLQFESNGIHATFFIMLSTKENSQVLEFKHPFAKTAWWFRAAGRILKYEEAIKVFSPRLPAVRAAKRQGILPVHTMKQILKVSKKKASYTGRRIAMAKGAQ